MKDPTTNHVGSLVFSRFSSTVFVPLRTAIAEILTSEFSYSDESAADYSDQKVGDIFGYIENRMSDDRDNGVAAHLQLDGDSDDAFLKHIGSPAVSEYLKRLKLIHPTDFEVFCGKVLSAMGANRSEVTGRSNDQGIDFFANELSICTPSSVGARIHIVGQAKRYTDGLISETDIRKFVGGAIKRVSDPKDKVYRAERLAPVIYAYWTTSDFDAGGLKFAKAIGLWHLNGMGLTQLAMRHGVEI